MVAAIIDNDNAPDEIWLVENIGGRDADEYLQSGGSQTREYTANQSLNAGRWGLLEYIYRPTYPRNITELDVAQAASRNVNAIYQPEGNVPLPFGNCATFIAGVMKDLGAPQPVKNSKAFRFLGWVPNDFLTDTTWYTTRIGVASFQGIAPAGVEHDQ